jgi:hypothetical protein
MRLLKYIIDNKMATIGSRLLLRITMVTKKDLAERLSIDTKNISQIGKKQLFIVNSKNFRYTRLYSYYTQVGFLSDKTWIITTEKYSKTTAKQLTQFKNLALKKGYDVITSEEI